MMTMIAQCQTCRFWQDVTYRVYARIPGKLGTQWRGDLELRPCQFSPAPVVHVTNTSPGYIYTSGDFTCSDWQQAT